MMMLNQWDIEVFPHENTGKRTINSISIVKEETSGYWVDSFLAGNRLSVFLDISPDSSAANTRKLKLILTWLSGRASKLTIVEGSCLRRWDFMGLEDMTESEAAEKAFRRASANERRIRGIIGDMQLEDCEFLDWRIILAHPDFKKVHLAIKSFVQECPAFATDVHEQAKDFLTRMTVSRKRMLRPGAIEYLKEYVIEEIAAFVYLHANEQIPIEVYAGADMPIMRKISKGYFENFPVPIPERTHISIKFQLEQIRAAEKADWLAIQSIIKAWPTHYVDAAMPLIESDFKRGKTFIWERNRQVLAFLIWDTNGSEIEMKWLAVAPFATGSGIGSSLVNAVIDSATTEKRVFLLTATTDSEIPGTRFRGSDFSATIRFFEGLGFSKASVIEKIWGERNNALLMEKFLR